MTGRGFTRFLQNLHRGFIHVQHGALEQHITHQIVQGLQGLGGADHGAGQGLARHGHAVSVWMDWTSVCRSFRTRACNCCSNAPVAPSTASVGSGRSGTPPAKRRLVCSRPRMQLQSWSMRRPISTKTSRAHAVFAAPDAQRESVQRDPGQANTTSVCPWDWLRHAFTNSFPLKEDRQDQLW